MRYAARRIFTVVVTLWAAITLNFLIPRLMPGTPADAALAKFQGVGAIDPAQRKAIEVTLGVPHGSWWSQYTQYLSDIVHGHFGLSYTYFTPSVASVIGSALPWTLVLVGVVHL